MQSSDKGAPSRGAVEQDIRKSEPGTRPSFPREDVTTWQDFCGVLPSTRPAGEMTVEARRGMCLIKYKPNLVTDVGVPAVDTSPSGNVNICMGTPKLGPFTLFTVSPLPPPRLLVLTGFHPNTLPHPLTILCVLPNDLLLRIPLATVPTVPRHSLLLARH